MRKRIIAITGPSGAGKITLGNLIESRCNVFVPEHTTTRQARPDDRPGFYRYLPHEVYARLVEHGDFLITSGDGPVVDRKYGNFYGVLKYDVEEAFKHHDTVLLYVSYKDLEQLIELKKSGVEVDIVNLTFMDVENGVRDRIANDHARAHTEDDIRRRVDCAVDYEEKYGKAIERHATSKVYTDVLDIEETYQQVISDLGLEEDVM